LPPLDAKVSGDPAGMSEAIRILRIAAGGDGVGKLADGLTVFVPRTAPGDLAELSEVRRSGRMARGRLGALVESGPDRVAPRCRHYDADQCGGCQLQHLSLDAQLAARRAIVGDALRRIGRFEISDPALTPAPDPWQYRAKITVTVGKRGEVGFHPLHRADQVFELVRCEIAREELNRLWTSLRAERAWWPMRVAQLILRLDHEGRCHVIMVDAGTEAWTRAHQLDQALAARGTPAVLWWQPPNGSARVVAGGASAFPATVFEQVHPAMGARARAHAVEQLGPIAGLHAWDLYAGIGDTTVALAERGATVESIERDPRATEEAERRTAPWRDQVRPVAGRAEETLQSFRRPDVVVANPPRGGMDSAVIVALRRAAPRRVVYISCDPATLARDLARLVEPGGPPLVLSTVQAFDLFPQTAHVETVAVVEQR
jgi:23S rRNA (uracil1939-C5)-methyltransferase